MISGRTENREFTYEEVSKATASGFLKVFDELFMLCTDRFECSLKMWKEIHILNGVQFLQKQKQLTMNVFFPKQNL